MSVIDGAAVVMQRERLVQISASGNAEWWAIRGGKKGEDL